MNAKGIHEERKAKRIEKNDKLGFIGARHKSIYDNFNPQLANYFEKSK